MRFITKTTARVISLILAAILMLTAFPVSAFAAVDAPLNGVTGDGWDDFGGMYGYDDNEVIGSDYTDDSTSSYSEYDNDYFDAEELPTADNGTPTDISLGISGEITDSLDAATPSTTTGEPDDGVLAEWFESYRQWAMSLAIQTYSSIGDTGSPSTTPLTWSYPSGDPVLGRVYFSDGSYIGSPIPKISIKGEMAFCYEWNDSTPGGNYIAHTVGDDPVIKQILANFDASNTSSSANYLAAQILIWAHLRGLSITSWGNCPGASAASSMLNGVADASNIEYLIWGGGSQTIITYTNTPGDRYQLKIVRKNEDGSKTVSNATFEVTGPGGYNYTGKTNSQGQIVLNLENPGTYTITETIPPAGYDPADPDTQTVTLNDENKTEEVVFYNRMTPGGTPDPEGGNYHIEVETTVDTETEVYNQKSYSYSDAIGQITIRKHDQDGKSLDGALFDIDVAFTDGSHTTVNNWEINNGARLFTWTHPQDNHDPATVTVTEVQPPRYYTGDPTPKTAVVHPTYTRVTHVETWTVTITTESTSCTVIDIDNGDVVASSNSSSSDSVTSDPQVEEFVDFVEGDRETTVTFVNQRITGDIIVTKKDANTGQPLAGASVHLWGTDLGEPSNIDRTLVTGADGTAVFDNLPPGTYSFQETQPPFGYNLNSDLQTAVLQSDQVLHKEIRNYRKDGLIIKKTDQNGVPLPGAVFELRRGSGEVLLSDVTNENGIILRDYLVEGLYVIEEIQAPDGYLLDENPIKELYIYEADDNKQYTIAFVNKKRPSIEITKVDGDTPTIKLEGAVFRITDTLTNQYWDIQTGVDGTALLENLDLNTTYIVQELEAPQGYVNSGYRQEIVLKECRKHTITVSNHHMPKMTIIKKDISSGNLLAGATFRVSWNGGADYRDITTDEKGEAVIMGLTPGWYSVTEVKSPAGYLLNSTPQQILIVDGQDKVIELFNEAKPSLKIIKVDDVTKTPLQYAEFSIYKKNENGEKYIGKYISDANGEIYLEDIDPGRYIIREIKAPDGYNIDTESHEITIEFGRKYELEFTNTPQSPIYIQKVDDKGNPLIGAKFKVTTMNGAIIGTVTTGRTGYAIIPYAEPGWYVIDEIQAPDGYILSSTPVNIEVKSGRPAQVEFVNYKKPQLSILKLDSSDNKALMGARIKVAKTNGEIIGTYTSDINGLVTLTDLEAGSYTVTEIAAPDGYILEMTPQIVVLKAGESKQIELYNTAKPGLQLKKLDKLTNMPVANAVFSLVKLESGAKRDLGTYNTGENGLFYVPDLSPGNYVLTEIKAPTGYMLDPTPQNIYIEGGKLNTVSVFNIPYSSLRILKISADNDRKPLSGAIFKLFDELRLEIGTYETSALGEIMIPQLPAGTYYLQETKAPAGFVLDSTVHKIELIGGKTTVVEVKNNELGSLRILKRSKEDGKPLYGATFLLYDSRNNLLGEFITDQNGLIVFGKNLSAGTYKIKEIKAPDGFVLDETIRTVTVKEGETTEVVIDNTSMRGRIQITKKAVEYNDITKDKAGALLKGAVFEIIDSRNKVVDRIETDSRGIATSKMLQLGVYGIREITAPKHYLLDDKVFYAEVKVHDDLIQFEVLNKPADISVTVQKYGNYEAMPGDIIRYDFKDISNTSTVALDNFYFHDAIPTDALRLTKIQTGTWNEKLIYKVMYKTNLRDYRVLADKLHAETNNELDCRREALKLKNGEFITDIKFVFGTVQAGFKEVTPPAIFCAVNGDLPNEYRFSNRCDVGGRHDGEPTVSKDAWVCIIYAKPRGKLPKTGF